MQLVYLIAGIAVFFDGIGYFLIYPGSELTRWLHERRERTWMKLWPPVQWALDSEKARFAAGIAHTVIGMGLICAYLFLR